MQRTLLSVGLLLAIALPCHAQGKPNTLSAKEIADGWILLFDGETTFGWGVAFPNGGKLPRIADGAMDFGQLGESIVAFSAGFSSFDLEFEYKSPMKGVASLRINDKQNKEGLSTGSGFDYVDTWTRFSAQLKNRDFYFNGKRLRDDPFFKEDKRPAPPVCAIGFEYRQGPVLVRNIKLRPLNMTPLFSGKDLDGWREIPGKKSQFAVSDNAINVKDGPGDLQTVGKYKDFILQLECKSNGKHLNSGIFFRCRENEYQNGYEAQIFNKFSKEPTQKYLVDEYDPKNNKLLGKKEVMSTAFDFGTGAIYRRVPARKEMSKDGEWFGMTIVAHGNHLATWVNGVQVTDWYDNRPKSDNARTGCRLEGGHISIQGHDPTTDLSFRNFRIAELK